MENKDKTTSSFKRMMDSFRKSLVFSRSSNRQSKSSSTSSCGQQEPEVDLEQKSLTEGPIPYQSVYSSNEDKPGCPLHEEQRETSFCTECETFACCQCQNEFQHAQCGPLLTLDNAYTCHFVQMRISKVKNFRVRVTEIRMELYDYVAHLEVARRQHWRDAWTARRMILDMASQLISSVEDKRDSLLEELNSCEESLNECLDYFLNESKALLKHQSRVLFEIDQFLSTPFSKSFMKQYKNHVKNHSQVLKVCLNSVECVSAVNTTIRFTPDKSFSYATNSFETVNLGTVYAQPLPGLDENSAMKRWFTHFSKIGNFSLYLHPPPIIPQLLSDVLSRGKSESSYLRDVIALPDNQYVVIDGGEAISRYSSDGFSTGKIMLATEDKDSSALDQSVTVDTNQIDIRACCGCRWSKDRLALTLPNGEIRIMNMASDMITESKGKLKKKYWGVAKVNERTLACVACVSATIDLIRVDGESFRVAKTLHCQFGPNTTRARYLAITPDLCLVVTDGDIVQCLDFQGNTKFLIDSIAHPAGVTADATYIYVCDRDLSRIFRLTTKGEVDCVLLTKYDGLSNPEAIDVTNNGRLLVTKWRGGRIMTFTLSEIMV